MTSKRVFVLEPNLILNTGHPVEYTTAILHYCAKKGLDAQCIANKLVNEETQKQVGPLTPSLSYSCFQHLEDAGNTFCQDLEEVDKLFKFNESDLVLVATSYINEIYGVAKYFGKRRNRYVPHCALWFHQLYPPTNVFQYSTGRDYQLYWMSELTKAFKSIPIEVPVSFWTTPATLLNLDFSRLAARHVGVLPNPCDYKRAKLKKKKLGEEESGSLKCAFLGDGRYEKGLLVVLLSILEAKDRSTHYIIQELNTRGYSEEELSKLENAKRTLSDWDNVAFINKSLNSSQFYDLIHSVDVLLLPYHPLSYDRRVSSIFIQAIQCSKPVIVAAGTWLAEQVSEHRVGEIFTYKRTIYGTVSEFIKSKKRLESRLDEYRQAAHQSSTFYRRYYSINNLINRFHGIWI